MQRIAKLSFLASIYVCDRRSIIRDINIINRKLSLEEAKQKAIAKTESFGKASGQYASLYQLRGLYYDGNAYLSCSSAMEEKSTSAHEEFHMKVKEMDLDKKSSYPPLEESAAYAYETMAELGSRGVSESLCRYSRQARHSVRFLFALDRKGHEEMLMDSINRIFAYAWEVMAGDNVAIAISSAGDCMFYLECMAVLKRWGMKDGEKILLEAVGASDENGANAGRKFLLKSLPSRTREKLNSSYGIDLKGFRFRSLYSQKIEYKTWKW
ncbi:MAG: hypothetical protein NTY68_01255 [Candidatus Micrarchaeota archaeon]|nr:hypothetical protein [Candidatus Micrarchaeota archaeon]